MKKRGIRALTLMNLVKSRRSQMSQQQIIITAVVLGTLAVLIVGIYFASRQGYIDIGKAANLFKRLFG